MKKIVGWLKETKCLKKIVGCLKQIWKYKFYIIIVLLIGILIYINFIWNSKGNAIGNTLLAITTLISGITTILMTNRTIKINSELKKEQEEKLAKEKQRLAEEKRRIEKDRDRDLLEKVINYELNILKEYMRIRTKFGVFEDKYFRKDKCQDEMNNIVLDFTEVLGKSYEIQTLLTRCKVKFNWNVDFTFYEDINIVYDYINSVFNREREEQERLKIANRFKIKHMEDINIRIIVNKLAKKMQTLYNETVEIYGKILMEIN